MENKNIFSAALLALLLFASMVFAVTASGSLGEYVDDSVITTKVKAAILEEPSLKSLEINVETYNGVVQLSGFVSTQANIDLAIKIASTVDGVKSVKNDMHLK